MVRRLPHNRDQRRNRDRVRPPRAPGRRRSRRAAPPRSTSDGVPLRARRRAGEQHQAVAELAPPRSGHASPRPRPMPARDSSAAPGRSPPPVMDVERGGRLVQQHDGRLLRQHARDKHALPLAAGKRGKLAVAKVRAESVSARRVDHDTTIVRAQEAESRPGRGSGPWRRPRAR